MYRKYPKKEGRTFKYRLWSEREARRFYKTFGYYALSQKKSTLRQLVRELSNALTDEVFQEVEARLSDASNRKSYFEFYD